MRWLPPCVCDLDGTAQVVHLYSATGGFIPAAEKPGECRTDSGPFPGATSLLLWCSDLQAGGASEL